MGQKHRINKILIAVTGIILIVCVFMQQLQPYTSAFCKEMHRSLIRMSVDFGLANLAYDPESDHRLPAEWSTASILYLVPMSGYIEGRWIADTDVEDAATYEMILAKQANDENAVDENGQLIGEEETTQESSGQASAVMNISEEALANYEYLVGNFYTIDGSTMVDSDLLNSQKMLEKNMKIDQTSQGPKILIYHTHSQESFVDSKKNDPSTSIVGIGAYLADLLNNKYEIETLHHQGVYDLIDGQLDRSKAYQLAEPEVKNILEKYPSIEVVIDLHRDGVAEDTHLVTEINGKKTAQIMFFNGLSRTRANGNIDYLPNPYIEDNLAFSFQMQLAAARKYPGFTRHIYLRAYRYNMHLAPKTLLVEAGAQTNTVEEMKNAMEILAETLDYVLVD